MAHAGGPAPRIPHATGGPLAIISGAGILPFTVAEAARAAGRRPVLFAVRGFADAEAVAAFDHHWIGVGQLGRFLRLARAEGCTEVVAIGGVVRPTLAQLWPDWKTLAMLPRVVSALRGGDDHLLRRVAAIMEREGMRVIGAHEIAPQILMPLGQVGAIGPSPRDAADIERGLAVLRATGPFDIGQAVVVADQRVLALEGAEGTDRMLAHLAALRSAGHIRVPKGAGVLVKAAKPGQDRRLDLPSIGPRTLEGAIQAGLAGLAVEAGSAVVAEPERIAALADRHGLFVIGMADGGGVAEGAAP